MSEFVFSGQALRDAALAIATEAHKGVFRKFGKQEPYIEHPKAVAALLPTFPRDDEMYAAALLHDVIEDTHIGPGNLIEKGIPETVVDLVLCLTRGADESYEEFIQRAKRSPRARIIKAADLLHNMSTLPEGHKNLRKYQKAILTLVS